MSTDNNRGPKHRQTVADPEEFNQQRRLRSIHDARDRARKLRELTQDPSVDADQRTLAATYRAAVQNYIGEIEGILQRYEVDPDEPDYWKEYKVGTVEINPPVELQRLVQRPDVTVIDASDLTTETVHIRGLREYLSADCPFERTFSLPIQEKHKGQKSKTATVSMEMPISISYMAYRIANQFLARVDLDVKLQSGGQDTIRNFDQSTDEPTAEFTSVEFEGNPEL